MFFSPSKQHRLWHFHMLLLIGTLFPSCDIQSTTWRACTVHDVPTVYAWGPYTTNDAQLSDVNLLKGFIISHSLYGSFTIGTFTNNLGLIMAKIIIMIIFYQYWCQIIQHDHSLTLETSFHSILRLIFYLKIIHGNKSGRSRGGFDV